MRVLLTTIGSFGDLNPYIGLGLALKRRGHQPVLAVANAYRPHVEAAGLECRPVGPHGDPWIATWSRASCIRFEARNSWCAIC